MGRMITVDTLNDWVVNEEKQGTDFSLKAMFYLMPEDMPSSERDALLRATLQIINATPRPFLEGKAPRDVVAHVGLRSRANIHAYGMEQFIPCLERASEAMSRGDAREAYRTFETSVDQMLHEKAPVFFAFRVFTNAAICQRQMEKYGTCKALLSAAMRLNPLYDFGEQTMKKYTEEIASLSSVPKREQSRVRRWLIEEERLGEQRYRRSSFYRYEKWLKEMGISLAYKTKTTPNIYGPFPDRTRL